jgi:hypothetical protein
MHRAFEAVCARLQLSVGSGDRVTELVGRKIIELARAGEHDSDRLTARVLAEFGIENDGSLWRHQRHSSAPTPIPTSDGRRPLSAPRW